VSGTHTDNVAPTIVTTRRAFAVVPIALMVLALAVSAHAQAQVQRPPTPGKWGRLAPFPEPAQEIGGTTVNGKVYILGGLPTGNNSRPKGLVWEYDSATDKWTKKKQMPLPAHHIAVVQYHGKLYVFGGGAQVEPGGLNWVPINNAWEYDPASDTWKALAPMPTARGAAVAAVVGDKIYVIGGASVHPGAKIVGLSATVPHRALGTNEAYDPATNTWQTRSPMPTSRNHAAIGVVNNKIYVLGGRLGAVFVNASATDVVEEYDPATDSWGFAKAKMPMPRSGTAYGSYGGKIYVAGGEYLDNELVGTYRSFEAFDPVANEWTSLPGLVTPRHGVVGGIIGNRFYVVSGHLQSGAIYGDALDSDETDAFEIPSE
jgi:N-acetylneuraminic acid mutarotase